MFYNSTQLEHLCASPSAQATAANILEHRTPKNRKANMAKLIRDPNVEIDKIKPSTLEEIFRTLQKTEPNTNRVTTPLRHKKLKQLRMVWHDDNIVLTDHGHLWKRSECHRLKTTDHIWMHEDAVPTAQKPKVDAKKIVIQTRPHKQINHPEEFIYKMPWLGDCEYIRFTINSEFAEADLTAFCKDLVGEIGIYRQTITSSWTREQREYQREYGDNETSAMGTFASQQLLKRLAATTSRVMLYNYNTQEETQTYYRRQDLQIERRNTETNNCKNQEKNEQEIIQHRMAQAIVKDSHNGTLTWVDQPLNQFLNPRKKSTPYQIKNQNGSRTNTPEEIQKKLEAGLENKQRQKIGEGLQLDDKQPTKYVTRWYTQWLEAIKTGHCICRHTPDGQTWWPIHEILPGKRKDQERHCCIATTETGQYAVFELTPPANRWAMTHLKNWWLAQGVEDPINTALTNSSTTRLCPPDQWEEIQTWFTPPTNIFDEIIADQSHCFEINGIQQKAEIQSVWIKNILELIMTRLIWINIQNLLAQYTEAEMKEITLRTVVENNLKYSQTSYVRPVQPRTKDIWNGERLKEIIANAPEIKHRKEAWNYCLNLPELDQLANLDEIANNL